MYIISVMRKRKLEHDKYLFGKLLMYNIYPDSSITGYLPHISFPIYLPKVISLVLSSQTGILNLALLLRWYLYSIIKFYNASLYLCYQKLC